MQGLDGDLLAFKGEQIPNTCVMRVLSVARHPDFLLRDLHCEVNCQYLYCASIPSWQTNPFFLVPIFDGRSGRLQLQMHRKCSCRNYQYITRGTARLKSPKIFCVVQCNTDMSPDSEQKGRPDSEPLCIPPAPLETGKPREPHRQASTPDDVSLAYLVFDSYV
jgi:hypothetical protein